jgi:hypothetical protein
MPPGIFLNGCRSIQRRGDLRPTRKLPQSFGFVENDLRTSVHVPATALNLCPCPFCNGRSFQSIQAITPRKDKLQLLREHNWLAIANLVNDLYAHGDTRSPTLKKSCGSDAQSPGFNSPESGRVSGHQHQPVFEVLWDTDDFPDLLFGENGGKSARVFGQVEADLDLLVHNMFVEKAQAGQNQAATGRRIALFVFQIQQVILDHLLGDGFRRLLVVFG